MDGALVFWLHEFVVAQPRLRDLTILMAELGVFVLPLVLAVSWLVPGETLATRRRAVLAGCLAAVAAIAVGLVLERVLGRPRPFVELGFTPLIAHAADSSFPSDHNLVPLRHHRHKRVGSWDRRAGSARRDCRARESATLTEARIWNLLRNDSAWAAYGSRACHDGSRHAY